MMNQSPPNPPVSVVPAPSMLLPPLRPPRLGGLY